MKLRNHIAALEGSIAELGTADCVRLLGELERLKAVAWVRMMTQQRAAGTRPASGPLLTLPQVADMLAIPEGRAYELARQGKLPSLRIGKYIRVSGEQLAEFQRRQALGDAT